MSTKELPISFKIIKVEENQFSVFEDTLTLDEPIQQHVGFGFGAEVESNTIAVAIEFVLHKKDMPLLKLEISCYFDIEPNAFQNILKQETKVVLPCDFAKHLAMITTGTARGVLFANTKNTPFNLYLIGLINVDKMFGEDIIIEL